MEKVDAQADQSEQDHSRRDGSLCQERSAEEACQEGEEMSLAKSGFGAAIEALKNGKRVARSGWNGRGMFVYLVPAGAYPARTEAAKEYFGAEALVPYNPYMAIKNVDDSVSTWVPSVNDVLAEDWELVE